MYSKRLLFANLTPSMFIPRPFLSAAVCFVCLFALTVGLFTPVVHAQSNTPSRASASSDPAAANQQVGYLLADKVYTEPDAFSEEVTSVTRDDQVRVSPVADQEGWYEVYKVDDAARVGYAFRPYVSRFGSAGLSTYKPSEPARPVSQTASGDQPLFEVSFAAVPEGTGALRIVNEWANVRVGPGLNHEAFGVVRPGVPFHVIGLERGWGKVRLQGEREIGYVSATLFHTLPDVEPAEPAPIAQQDVQQGVRSAVIGGVAGGGAEGQVPNTQAEALREVLTGSGVDGEATVYVTRTGRKFHRDGCKHLRSRTFAIPLAEAMLDYSPCRTCKPLQPVNEGGNEAPGGETTLGGDAEEPEGDA